MIVTVTNYANPKYVDESGMIINLDIETKEYGWIPTTMIMDEDDPHEHVLQIKQWLRDNQSLIAPYVEPPTPPVPIPQVVSMRQARLALLQNNLLSQVDSVIAAMPSPDKEAAQIEWEYATEVHRDNQLFAAMSIQLGLDETDLDNLFIQAASI